MKKEREAINKGQGEMKNTISELKNTVEGCLLYTSDAADEDSPV